MNSTERIAIAENHEKPRDLSHKQPASEVVVASIRYFPNGRTCILKGRIRTRILLECLSPECEFSHHTRDAIRNEWEREFARGRQGYVCRLSQAAGYLELPTAELGGWLRLLRYFCQRLVTPRVPVRVWVMEAGEFDDYHDPDYDGSDDEDEEDEDGDYDGE